MRKAKKKELMNCIDTLQKANGKVLNIDGANRVDFLTQCQEMAIMVGTEIDKIEGEGVITVSYLEQYCEEIYLMSVAVDRGDLIQAQKRAHTLLGQIKGSIIADIPDSPAEVVFLPYKASMWDALDSVYRAAVADGNCNVTVMPIPYFNINPQGEVLAVEYEGALFPKDIKITDFRDYDLEAMHPDVIFIHNPYDEWNHVTQVPKEFFSSTLVNYTEHLVYIPYFVTKGDTIKDDYCYMPAVRNAWRTFVQSDAVRDCYVKNGADPKKIVAMGSPKFDMVLQMQENPPAMPEEWKAALGGRKIFLLNTHLNPIINEAEKTIDKLQQIFQLFKERDDVALLWRPHPLSIQTAKSMNPRILEQYMQLIEAFKSLPNGVYDDTPDVHRAIALSDAYIGHGSSLVTMYGITGKPMYMLSVSGDANVRIPEKEKYLQFACGVVHEGYLWAPAEKYNALFKMNLQSGKLTFVTHFENEGMLTPKMFHEVIVYRDKLFFIPKWAKNIIVYLLATGEQKVIEADAGESTYATKYDKAVTYEDKIYMFSAGAPCTMCIDMNTLETESFSECCEKIEKEGIEWKSVFSSGIKADGRTWLGIYGKNVLIEFAFETRQAKIIHVGLETEGMLNMYEQKNQLYILSNKGRIYRYDIIIGDVELVWEYFEETERTPYFNLFVKDEFMWLLPHGADNILKVNMRTKEAKKCLLPESYAVWEETGFLSKSFDYVTDNKVLMMCPNNSNALIKLDLETDEIETVITELGTEVPNIAVDNTMKQIGMNTQYVYGEEWCPTEDFVNCVVAERESMQDERKQAFGKKQSYIDGTSGKHIWEYITNS